MMIYVICHECQITMTNITFHIKFKIFILFYIYF